MFIETSLNEIYTSGLHTNDGSPYIMQVHAYGHKRKSGEADFDTILVFFLAIQEIESLKVVKAS